MSRIQDELVLREKFMRQIPQIRRVAEGTRRDQIAVALCQLSIEHHDGLITLVQDGQFSPAFAMFRPQMEAWLRSLWVSGQAPDNELEAFMAGEEFVPAMNPKTSLMDKKKRIPPSIKESIGDIKDANERDALLENYEKTWKFLCDLTHGGAYQINARLQEHGIEARYPEEHIGGLVHASTRLSYLAMMEMGERLQDEELMDSVHNIFTSIYPPTAPPP